MSVWRLCGSRCLRILVLLAVVASLSQARTINCRACAGRVNVFHERCRGVARRSGALPSSTHGSDGELRRFLTAYLSDQSKTRKLRALEHYLATDYPGHPSATETASLLDRLLPTLDDNEDDYTSDI